jgi:hypothetical protein
MAQNFWMIVSSPENFQITRDLGFTAQGLKAQHRRKIQRIVSGDRVLFYVYGSRRFTATATATSSYVEDDSETWQNEGSAGWPYRIQIKPEVVLDDHQYINANLLAPRLDYIRRWTPENWHMAFQGNLHLLPKNDFLLIEEEMKKLKFGREYQRTSPIQTQGGTTRKRRRGGGRPRAPAGQPANNT